MAARTPQAALDNAGVQLTWNAASAGGDTMANTNLRTVTLVRNSHATDPRTVTIAAVVTARTAGGKFPAMTLANLAIIVAAGEVVAIGPLPDAYNHLTTDVLTMTYSDSGADLEIAGYEVP